MRPQSGYVSLGFKGVLGQSHKCRVKGIIVLTEVGIEEWAEETAQKGP